MEVSHLRHEDAEIKYPRPRRHPRASSLQQVPCHRQHDTQRKRGGPQDFFCFWQFESRSTSTTTSHLPRGAQSCAAHSAVTQLQRLQPHQDRGANLSTPLLTFYSEVTTAFDERRILRPQPRQHPRALHCNLQQFSVPTTTTRSGSVVGQYFFLLCALDISSRGTAEHSPDH